MKRYTFVPFYSAQSFFEDYILYLSLFLAIKNWENFTDQKFYIDQKSNIPTKNFIFSDSSKQFSRNQYIHKSF